MAIGMTPDELRHRTQTFAIEVIKLARSLPADFVTAHLARQLMRSGTSVGANYRSSCRAKSPADFIAKMSTVEEEADETGYWLELLIETNVVSPRAAAALISEAEQLTRIVVASIKTARGRSR
jgi:four helix bundle protein